MSVSRACAASAVLLGAVFAGVAFGAAGGTQLGRTAAVEVVLIVLCTVLAGASLAFGRRGPLYGGTTLLLLGALAALVALSVLWSVAPDLTFIEAGRHFAYLAVFAAALGAARLAPRESAVLLHAVLLGAGAVTLYALASRVWPGALAPDELANRIGQPYQYWNAVGATAAILVPAALWLGSRRAASPAARALAYPVLGAAILAILLTQSRGALAAAVVGAVLWFVFVPLRLRSLPVLLVPAAGAAPVGAWALSKDAFSNSLAPLSSKQAVAGEFGLLVLLMLVALLLVGFAIEAGRERLAPPLRMHRPIGIAAAAVACAVPLVLFTSVAFSDRGIGGTVDELTSESAAAPTEGAGRLAAASNSRSSFWREAAKVFKAREGLGTGAGTFAISRLRYRKSEQVSRHAHGWIPQTMADLGILGLGVSLALLAAWLAAAARTTGLFPRLRRRGRPIERRDWTPERMTLVALTLVAVVFGLQSAIDWTWFVPGPAVMALAAAGFVAGRGPLGAPLAATGAGALGAAPSGGRSFRLLGASLPVPPRPRLLAAAGLLACAVLLAWAAWQPEAADRGAERALELSEQGATSEAVAKARDAEDANPLSPKPLLVQASVLTAAGREAAAQRALERAVLRFPGDPQTWMRLASFHLGTRDRPREALDAVRGVLYLDPKSKAGRQLFLEASARLREQQVAASTRGRRG